MISIDRYCPSCAKMNVINDILESTEVWDDNGNKYTVLCYTCKHCGKTVAVQIDSNETLLIKEKLTNVILRAMKCKNAGQPIPNKLVKAKNSLDGKLNKRRAALASLSEGRKFYNRDGSVFMEDFKLD